jgi:hypothetical protein
MREITPNEVSKLYDCIRELSDYHNTTLESKDKGEPS